MRDLTNPVAEWPQIPTVTLQTLVKRLPRTVDTVRSGGLWEVVLSANPILMPLEWDVQLAHIVRVSWSGVDIFLPIKCMHTERFESRSHAKT